ncbi:MAG: hypothetical protein ACPGYT_07425 [Nitrospirales bacterium]
MTNQTKVQVLVGLLLVWGGTVVFQYLEEAENPTSAPNQYNATTEQPLSDIGDLTLAKNFLHPRQRISLSTPRNIFNPLNLYPAKQPLRSKPVALAKPIIQPKIIQPTRLVPSGPSPVELATQRAQEQLRQFRFLGYLKKGGESQAFLTKGQSIYIVKQGATVEGKILVQRIDPTLIVLSTQVLESGDHVKAEIPLTKESQKS